MSGLYALGAVLYALQELLTLVDKTMHELCGGQLIAGHRFGAHP